MTALAGRARATPVTARPAQRRESSVEDHLIAAARRHDALCLKFVSPGRTGVPDRILISPEFGTVFVELKRPGQVGSVRPKQRATHAKMRRYGARIFVVDTTADVDALIAGLVAEDGPDKQ